MKGAWSWAVRMKCTLRYATWVEPLTLDSYVASVTWIPCEYGTSGLSWWAQRPRHASSMQSNSFCISCSTSLNPFQVTTLLCVILSYLKVDCWQIPSARWKTLGEDEAGNWAEGRPSITRQVTTHSKHGKWAIQQAQKRSEAHLLPQGTNCMCCPLPRLPCCSLAANPPSCVWNTTGVPHTTHPHENKQTQLIMYTP